MKLQDEVKLFIVRALACYDSPTQAAEAVKEEFGITVDRRQVHVYDPTREAGKNLSKKLRDLFDVTRKAFLDDAANVFVSHRSYRLRSLQRIHDEAMKRKNYVLAMNVLEQAAKETGGLFTNKVKVAGDSADPFVVWLNGLGKSALPVVQDVDGEDEEKPKSITWRH